MTRRPAKKKGPRPLTKAEQREAAERKARVERKQALRSSAIGAVVAAIAGAAAGAATTAGMKAMDGLRSVTGNNISGTPPVGGSAGTKPAPPFPGASRPAVGGDGFAGGGIGLAAFPTARLKPGATRDFLRANNPGDKPQFALAELTGIPADTIRKAMAWRNPSELSGPHLMRMVSVFGPPFLAAVLDPVPRWVADWMAREAAA